MRCRQSARLTPAAAMRINTSPALGSGTGRVAGTSISGPPGALISMTVCVAGMLASTGRFLSLVGCDLQYRAATRAGGGTIQASCSLACPACLAREVKAFNIRGAVVEPGPIATRGAGKVQAALPRTAYSQFRWLAG